MVLGTGGTCLIILHCLVVLAQSALTNITVDDSGLDPLTGRSISFSQNWSFGPQCLQCSITTEGILDLDQVYNRSWHDDTTFEASTAQENASFVFNGTAIYVYGILPNNRGSWEQNIGLTFHIDDEIIGTYSRALPNETAYNVLFFSNISLSSVQHTLVIENGAGPQTKASTALIDYLIYSHGAMDVVSSSKKTLHVAAIVGGLFGALTAIIAVFFLVRHRMKSRKVAKIRPFAQVTRAVPFIGLAASSRKPNKEYANMPDTSPSEPMPPSYDSIIA